MTDLNREAAGLGDSSDEPDEETPDAGADEPVEDDNDS